MNASSPLDLEARAHSEHAHELRLWLRLLTCSQLIEKRVRAGLREQFDTTLPRFDLMAQLERHPDGLKMKELSHRLMVTGGNVTGITDQLVNEGLVERMGVDGDRRAFRVRLTPHGRTSFTEMAQQHESWIVEAFEGLSPRDLDSLHKLLGKVKQHQLELNQRIEE
ncbi:MAG: MarR family transcriptional regulator [Hydrogenophaga sp.]|jgi:DNA-binding MarR family transcriptional regulator|uniref:MarR family winged helix-turn-helix transcriptional regulator n=1 Tax=Hydrogenophaga sp. TaxID=1904254 RepID=UPI002620E6D6|nr:MarR family transcriptional regulator [Hydrogenophaga sp.]MCW5669185.1 MarR family transcriptional regulator [Hydrogenophaga sp.]